MPTILICHYLSIHCDILIGIAIVIYAVTHEKHRFINNNLNIAVCFNSFKAILILIFYTIGIERQDGFDVNIVHSIKHHLTSIPIHLKIVIQQDIAI